MQLAASGPLFEVQVLVWAAHVATAAVLHAWLRIIRP